MNLKLIKLLAGISAVLCLIILCEWVYAIYAQKNLLSSVQAQDKQKISTVELPSLELTKEPETNYNEMVTRPLFLPGRRPVAESSSTDTKPAAVANQPFSWALNGVYTHKNQLYALLSRTTAKANKKDNFQKVTKDSDIDGWKLTEIYYDKVVVTQGDQKKDLPLRKPKPKTLPPTPENPQMPQPIPGQPPQPMVPPDQQVVIPPEQQIPVPTEQMPIPEPSPEELEPIMEPEMMPDESSETYFENNQNELYQ